MILTENIEIKIYKNSKNKNYYKNIGYKIDDKTDKIFVKTSDLPKSSTYKVDIICDICGKIYKVEYRQYINNIRSYNYYSCKGKCSNTKTKNTLLSLYGDENYNNKEKNIKTCIKKYGVKNVFQNDKIINKIREKLIKKGYRVNENDYTKFVNYHKKCMSLTQINIRKYKFKQDWNGIDYYDGEYIKDNYNLYTPHNENYPNIDHKISIIYGFLNGISVEEISSINNLCFTKRKHNMSKKCKTEKEYINFGI